jgi:hypothetical protein
LTACPVRLRPILMTSLATMVGALPLAMGLGPGAETRAPLARSIIGGIFLSTLITIVVVPVFYLLFDQFGTWVRHMAQRQPAEKRDRPRTPPFQPPHGEAVRVGAVAETKESVLEPALEVRPQAAT